MSNDLCARCGRQTPEVEALAWIGGHTICVDCFTLAEYQEARGRLRINARQYCASDNPKMRQIGEQIHHLLDLADKVERLHPDVLGAAWPQDVHGRFDPTRPREEKP